MPTCKPSATFYSRMPPPNRCTLSELTMLASIAARPLAAIAARKVSVTQGQYTHRLQRGAAKCLGDRSSLSNQHIHVATVMALLMASDSAAAYNPSNVGTKKRKDYTIQRQSNVGSMSIQLGSGLAQTSMWMAPPL